MRSLCTATGLFLLLWGIIFLMTRQMEVLWYRDFPWFSSWMTQWSNDRSVFHPPEWAAFSLCSLGFVLMIFSVGLPQRQTRPPILRFIPAQR